MSATPVLEFPAPVLCPTCNRPCSIEDLSECLRCGQQYCRHDSWECECDREAEEIVARARRITPALTRFLTGLF